MQTIFQLFLFTFVPLDWIEMKMQDWQLIFFQFSVMSHFQMIKKEMVKLTKLD